MIRVLFLVLGWVFQAFSAVNHKWNGMKPTNVLRVLLQRSFIESQAMTIVVKKISRPVMPVCRYLHVAHSGDMAALIAGYE